MQTTPSALALRMLAIERALTALSASFDDEIDCFGLDQKVLLMAERGGRDASIFKAYYRPVQEPVLVSMWEKLTALSFDGEQATEVASLLVGSRQRIRTKRMAGQAPDGSVCVFAKRPALYWTETIRSEAANTDGAIKLAAKLFQIVVYEHPFTDGNGRFSRAMIYSALARFGLIKNPCLGLNGAYELHRETMALAFRQSHTQGSPQPMMEAITTLLEDSVGLVRALLERSNTRSFEA
jgi:hypothetical protein